MANQNEKTLTLYPVNQKFHTVYDSTIEFFKERYNLEYSPPIQSRLYKVKNNLFLRNSYYFLVKLCRKIFPNQKKNLGIDPRDRLLFCFNELPPEGYDFILDLEIVTGLAEYHYDGLDKEYLSNRLSSENCKAIICWNKSSYISLTKTIDCSRFKKKTKIIPFGRKLSQPDKFSSKNQKNQKKTFNLLFVSSINNPTDFETKGGLIVLEAFKILAKKYPNLRFFVRANVKREVEESYQIPGLTFHKGLLSDEEMQKLLSDADLLFEPIPGIALMLECMDYGIPAITFDYWCVPEYVIDKKGGFNIDSSKIFGKITDKDYFKNLSNNYLKLFDKENCMLHVPPFMENVEVLIHNPSILKKMSSYQQSLLKDKNKYSLDERNEKLTKLINKFIKND